MANYNKDKLKANALEAFIENLSAVREIVSISPEGDFTVEEKIEINLIFSSFLDAFEKDLASLMKSELSGLEDVIDAESLAMDVIKTYNQIEYEGKKTYLYAYRPRHNHGEGQLFIGGAFDLVQQAFAKTIEESKDLIDKNSFEEVTPKTALNSRSAELLVRLLEDKHTVEVFVHSAWTKVELDSRADAADLTDGDWRSLPKSDPEFKESIEEGLGKVLKYLDSQISTNSNVTLGECQEHSRNYCKELSPSNDFLANTSDEMIKSMFEQVVNDAKSFSMHKSIKDSIGSEGWANSLKEDTSKSGHPER